MRTEADGFLTARHLEVEAWERDGLIAVMNGLVEGRLKLDMTSCSAAAEAVCIGTHLSAFQIAPRPLMASTYMRGQLTGPMGHLFFPGATDHPAWRAGARDGARAICKWLRGSRSRCWTEALAPEPEAADA